MKDLKTRTALEMYDDRVVKFGAFRLKSHSRWPDAPLSPFYLNIRIPPKGELTIPTLRNIGRCLVKHCEIPEWFDFVVGLPEAGVPIVEWYEVSLYRTGVLNLQLSKSGEGDERKIILTLGEAYRSGARVVVVDDLITKADTKLEAARVLRSKGMIVEHCLVVVDRMQGGREELAAEGIELHSVFTVPELLGIYKDNSLIDQAKIDEVLNYQAEFDRYVAAHPTNG